MNKPLLGSLVAASLLLADASAATMYERFEVMETEMKRLQQELSTLKAEKKAAKPSARMQNDDEEDEDEDEKAGSSENEDDEDEFNAQEEIEDMQETITELNKATAGNHLKLGVDFRTSFDNVNYKMASGETSGKKYKNDAILANRLWLNMDWAATKNISFTGQLAYNKLYGQRFGASLPEGNQAEPFDWITNENAYDDTVRVRSAYFFYRNDTFLGTDIPWTFSLGRRPSTNGHLINFRENDQAASPSGHTINVEFDGLSSRFGLEKVTGIPGMYVKLCGGRAASNASPRFSTTPYATNDSELASIDLAGLIFVPYDNGQFSIGTQFYTANNLIDLKNPQDQMEGFQTVGNINSASAYMMTNGIGNGWSNFLDDTTFFVSGAMSQTDPKNGAGGMLGSTDKENGYSYWAGLNMPSLISDEGRFGLEFNHGSKYWRPITYGEDTMIGSKVAARGNAYEVYFTEPLIDDIFTLQVRYTYIDYDYAGSNGFFGNATGGSMAISDTMMVPDGSGEFMNIADNVVDKAQDIRVYLRYRY
ncbi:MAG: DUF3373 family protein [Campylobacterales bacterium]|nr:DUF3373 family protein [Campylobacterales bacterium]